MTTALIFANGASGGDEPLPSPEKSSLVIAADGGLRHLVDRGLRAHVVIGDLDSAPPDLVRMAEQAGAEIIRFPVDKDKTDLELALDYAVASGAQDVVVMGALGGRVDHELANILLLTAERYQGIRVRYLGGPNASAGLELEEPDAIGCEFQVVTAWARIQGGTGDIITLLPLTPFVSGITVSGLKFPLDDDRLDQGSSRGVSNVMMSNEAEIRVGNGKLLVCRLIKADAG